MALNVRSRKPPMSRVGPVTSVSVLLKQGPLEEAIRMTANRYPATMRSYGSLFFVVPWVQQLGRRALVTPATNPASKTPCKTSSLATPHVPVNDR